MDDEFREELIDGEGPEFPEDEEESY